MSETRYKVYDPQGKHKASCNEIEAAAALMGFYGTESTIRIGLGKGKIAVLWTEGDDGFATDSYDTTAEIVSERENGVMRLLAEAKAKWLEDFPTMAEGAA